MVSYRLSETSVSKIHGQWKTLNGYLCLLQINAWVHAPAHTYASIYTRVWACVHAHEKNTNKSISGADVLTVPSSLPPLLAPHSGASVITLKYLRPCVMQWRHQCHPEIFPRQSHRASNCNYFRTSPLQQPSALASLWISNHANQAGMFTPCCLKGTS